MSRAYRYPGAKPFSTAEASIFFGRAREAELLQRRVRSEPMLVLYAKSGLGKSSLLNAGLLPKVQEQKELQAFSIRFGAFQSGMMESPLERVRDQLAAGAPLLDRLYEEQPRSLWYLLKALQFSRPEYKGVLLIFDQFEELFTYSETAIVEFARQLSEMLFTTIPDRYRKGIEQLLREQPETISEKELQQLHQPFMLRVVLAIRSDRLALLDRLKPFLPGVLDNTYELRPLSVEQAEDAILNPAYENNGFYSPVFDFEDAAVDHLINFLSHDRRQAIESFQLQILCEYVEQQLVIKQAKTKIRRQDLASPQAILEDYYLTKIQEISDISDQLAARRLIEEGLVFEEEERRLTLYEGQIEKSYGVTKSLLHQLVDAHLIRAEPSLRGGYTYELSHDTLVAPVLKAKTQRVREETEARAATEKAEREAELAAERRKRRRARRLALLMAFLALLSITAFIFALIQGDKARAATKEAQTRQREAEDALRRREELEVQNILQDAVRLEDAGQLTLAKQKLETAVGNIQSDSLKTLLNTQIDRLKSR